MHEHNKDEWIFITRRKYLRKKKSTIYTVMNITAFVS